MGRKDRPTARRTTAITPRSTSTSDVLTRFSPSTSSSTSSATYYAHLHRAPDAHTLRVYDASNGRCLSRWASDAHSLGGSGETDAEAEAEAATEEQQARHKVHAIEWAFVPTPKVEKEKEAEGGDQDGQGEKKRGKKRRKSDSQIETSVVQVQTVETTSPKLVLVMGQESGKLLVWSPNGKEEWSLSHPSVNSPVTALASPMTSGSTVGHLWSTHQDGIARVWDLTTKSLIARTNVLGDAVTAWDDLAVRYAAPPTPEEDKIPVHLVLSKASLQIYSLMVGTKSKKDKIKELKSTPVGRCTGHVDVATIEWVAQQKSDDSAMVQDTAMNPNDDLTFFTHSKTERFVQLWSFPLSSPSKDAHLVARLGLDSGVQAIASNATHLVAIDADGKGYLTSLPTTPLTTASSKKVQALKDETEVHGANLANVFLGSNKLVLCRSGVKPVFEQVEYLNEAGSLVEKITLEKSAGGLFANGQDEAVGTAPPSRYVETPTSNSRSAEPTLATEADDDDDLAHSGQLDVDMAEPTLADRLQAMNMSKARQNKDVLALREDDEEGSSGDDEEGLTSDEDDEDEDEEDDDGGLSTRLAAPATTLTTTLIQALHSSDAPLLESCLLHDSPTLIRSTVQKLPSGSLVLNLLEALVQRLGTGKGGKVGGTASVQRSRGLVEWVKQVLVVHVGFLVTIPSLVTRLSALHASLTNRLSIQPTLFALHGRLDLVLAQIQSRQNGLMKRRVGGKARGEGGEEKGTRYVEGESSSEEDGEDEDEDVDEDEGSVEDVMLGGDDDEEEEGLEGSEDDEEGSDAEGSEGEEEEEGVEGLLDLEASEEEEEEEEEEEDESD